MLMLMPMPLMMMPAVKEKISRTHFSEKGANGNYRFGRFQINKDFLTFFLKKKLKGHGNALWEGVPEKNMFLVCVFPMYWLPNKKKQNTDFFFCTMEMPGSGHPQNGPR